jgi:hypothetical protein
MKTSAALFSALSRLHPAPRALAVAVGVPGAFVVVACVYAVQPDLPLPPQHRPTILHEAVVPPADQILARIPTDGFAVSVEPGAPNEPFFFDVFIDYDPVVRSPPTIYPTLSSAATDGGIAVVRFALDETAQELDPAYCHRIEFLVAHAFNQSPVPTPHTPDSIGGDSVTWLYNGSGGAGGCPLYDASGLGASGWPLDAGSDALLVSPVMPESGSEP